MINLERNQLDGHFEEEWFSQLKKMTKSMAMQAMMQKRVIQNKMKLYQMKKAKKVMMVGLETAAAAVTKNKLQAAPSNFM